MAFTVGFGSRMSTTATAAPSFASPRAYAAPIPCAAPVTIATLFLRRMKDSSVGKLYNQGRRGASRIQTALNLTTQIRSGTIDDRSEERRVGKECRSRWSPYH